MTHGDRKRLKVLKRRVDFLSTRIENYRSDGSASRDKAEREALLWAIAIVQNALKPDQNDSHLTSDQLKEDDDELQADSHHE